MPALREWESSTPSTTTTGATASRARVESLRAKAAQSIGGSHEEMVSFMQGGIETSLEGVPPYLLRGGNTRRCHCCCYNHVCENTNQASAKEKRRASSGGLTPTLAQNTPRACPADKIIFCGRQGCSLFLLSCCCLLSLAAVRSEEI